MAHDSPRHALRFLMVVVLAASTLWAGYLLASSSGKFGEATTADGCQCHSAAANANGNATVTITGPQSVEVNTTNSYTIWVSGGPAGSTGGFNLKAQAGTLIAGADVQVGGTPAGTEITHTSNGSRIWHFDWTAPATAGPVDFYAVAQATNGSLKSGDSWNFYGGSVGTPFTITVTDATPTRKPSWGRLKARYR